MIAEPFVGLGFAERRRFIQIAGRGVRGERLEGTARVGGAAERELGEAFVVLDVLAQRMLAAAAAATGSAAPSRSSLRPPA